MRRADCSPPDPRAETWLRTGGMTVRVAGMMVTMMMVLMIMVVSATILIRMTSRRGVGGRGGGGPAALPDLRPLRPPPASMRCPRLRCGYPRGACSEAGKSRAEAGGRAGGGGPAALPDLREPKGGCSGALAKTAYDR